MIYRKQSVFLEKGLHLENGSRIWFPGSELSEFSDGLAVIDNGSRHGYIDRQGKIVIVPGFKSADDFSEGHAFVSDLKNTYIIDKEGDELMISDEPLIASCFKNGLAKVSKIDETGENRIDAIINAKGEFISEFKYSSPILNPFDLLGANDQYSCGLIRMANESKYGFIDTEGEILIPFIFDWVSKFEKGAAAFTLDGKGGFIDTECNIVISPVYEDAAFMMENLFFVKKNGLWGAVDCDGNLILDYLFDSISLPKNNFLPVRFEGRWGMLDFNGEHHIENRFDLPPRFNEGILKFVENGKTGVLNREGNELISDFINGSEISLIN